MTPNTILVTIAAAGTPQQLTADSSLRAVEIAFQPLDAISFLGIAGMNKTTFANVIRRMAVDADWRIKTDENQSQLQLSKYWLDATANGNKILVAYWD